NGNLDMFIAKYSAAGSYLWAKSFGTLGSDSLYGLAVDRNNGNVVFTGKLPGLYDISFGGVTLFSPNMFLVNVFGAYGSHIWSKSFASGSSAQGNCVTVSPSGEIGLAGQFADAIDLSTNEVWGPLPTTLNPTYDLSSRPTVDIFVAKFASNGAYL